MSMHEFEDLVEYSIRALADSALRDLLDVRSVCWWLYDFQNHWDTGFTHFRVMDSLLDFRFAYRFDLVQHPDYQRERAYFESLKDFAFILVTPNSAFGEGLLRSGQRLDERKSGRRILQSAEFVL